MIAIDLDNTLFTPNCYETFDNLSALYRAHEAGVSVCACTGRPWYNARHFFELFPFDELCITSNGAAIAETYTGKLREVHSMDPERLPALLDHLVAMDAIYDSVRASTNDFFAVWRPEQTERVVEDRGNWLFGQYPGRTFFYREKSDWVDVLKSGTQRLLLAFREMDQEKLIELKEELSAIMPVEPTISYKTMVEVMAPGCTKGGMVEHLAAMKGIRRENVMCIGDNINDISMIQWAGTGVCVHDGQPALKEAADLITPSYENGGLNVAVDYLLGV